MCRSFFVSFLYCFAAASNIEIKLEVEWSVVWLLVVAIWIAVWRNKKNGVG